MSTSARELTDFFNRECDCTLTDFAALRRRLDVELAAGDVGRPIAESHPHLFSPAPVFIDPEHAAQMHRIIEAIENTVRLPAWQQRVLGSAPPIARHDPRTSAVFMGFDFHVTPDGPRLIEINTNAGGAFLNAAARAAQSDCCDGDGRVMRAQPDAAALEQGIVGMFRHEWRLARGDEPLRTVAIVDENPQAQFLYPEFLLARNLFEAHGIRAFIVDPAELRVTDGRLRLRDEAIDLVYNRLTDFYFDQAASQALRAAYEADLAVVTPHPRAHALYADKKNLEILGDATQLESLGVPQPGIDILVRGIPKTREVAGCGENWWRERSGWFFKPRSGFGSRGTYRGDKMTRRVFADVMKGGYMAQQLIPPGERWRSSENGKHAFKVDVRCYAYGGRIQQMVARLYQGQTTNFRTAGGGFAPVLVVNPAAVSRVAHPLSGSG